MNNNKNVDTDADINCYTSCCAASTKDCNRGNKLFCGKSIDDQHNTICSEICDNICNCEQYSDDETCDNNEYDEEAEYIEYIELLNSENVESRINSANLETLLKWREMLFWRSKYVKESSFNLVSERLKKMCPHNNCVEETFEIDYDRMESCKICYDCKSVL
jgi:hypothetical protein